MPALIKPVPQGTSRVFGNGHNGIDYVSPTGTPVLAASAGTITFEGEGARNSWMTSLAGICVLIRHPDGYTGYAHLSRTVVSAGQPVAQGQVIGYSGNTGNSTGPHLHFELLPVSPNFNNGYSGRIDPAPHFQTNQPPQGGQQVIKNEPDYRIWYDRLMWFGRNRNISDEEFVKNFVGQDDFAMMKSVISGPENAEQAQNIAVGTIARRDNWQGQIHDLQAQLADLGKRPTQAQLDALVQQAADLQVSTQSAKKQAEIAVKEMQLMADKAQALEKQNEEDKAVADSWLRRLGQFISKYLPGNK